MGSVIGQKIDYNGLGALRGQRHINPSTPPPPGVAGVWSWGALACENICFSSLFAAGDVSRGNVPSYEERGETDVFAG